MKSILILGATGSIGASACDVVRTHPRDFCVAGIAVRSSRERAEALGREFNAPVFVGEDAALRAVEETEADLVLVSTVGLSGLAPTLAAIEKGENVALATKEVMVAAGELVCKRAEAKGVKILPVDSEHSAIFQCLEGNRGREVKKILLTCSGGPFRGKKREDMAGVTAKEALKHPKWNMGPKITTDSATLMNKGLEVIEAKWLFGVEADKIQVLVHPQSIVHSGVEFMDNSILCQLGIPDMRIPISLALGYPDRLANPDEELDMFGAGSNLTFMKPDLETFSCLKLAYYAIGEGGSCPVVMNAANEVLVEKFLRDEIGFLDIQDRLCDLVYKHKTQKSLMLEDIISIDRETREMIR